MFMFMMIPIWAGQFIFFFVRRLYCKKEMQRKDKGPKHLSIFYWQNRRKKWGNGNNPFQLQVKAQKAKKLGAKFASFLKWERQLGLFFLFYHYVFWYAIQSNKDREQEKRGDTELQGNIEGKLLFSPGLHSLSHIGVSPMMGETHLIHPSVRGMES